MGMLILSSAVNAAAAAAAFAPSSSQLTLLPTPLSFRCHPMAPQGSSNRRRQRQQYISTPTTKPTTSLYNNYLLDLIGLGSQDMEPETKLPYSPPLSLELSISDQTRTFAIMERPLSFTGEDFDIVTKKY